MSRKSILGIAAVACAPFMAWAQSGITLGPDAILHLTADGQVRFDDNVTLSDINKDGDVIFVVAPGLELNYNGGQSTALLVLTEQIIRYDDYRGYDGELFSGVGQYVYEGAKSKVTANASYREYSQGSISIRNREQAVRHDVTNTSIDGIWAVTAKTSLGAGLFYNATNYPGSTYVDMENYGAPLDFYYAATPKLDLSVGYRYRRSLVDELPSYTRSFDSKDHFFNVGARGEFTPKLKGQIRVGQGKRVFDEVPAGMDDSTDLFSFSGTLTYAYSPKASFDLTASKDFSNSATGVSQEVFAVRGGGKLELDPQWSVIGGVSYESSDYESARKDDFVTADLGVVYAMDENVSFNASYVHRTNFSTERFYDFSGNILSIGATLRY